MKKVLVIEVPINCGRKRCGKCVWLYRNESWHPWKCMIETPNVSIKDSITDTSPNPLRSNWCLEKEKV